LKKPTHALRRPMISGVLSYLLCSKTCVADDHI
jgi:hypothetical protein